MGRLKCRTSVARRLPWSRIEQDLSPAFAHQDRPAKAEVVADLLGEHALEFGGGVSTGVRHQIAQVFDLIGFRFYFWHYTAVSRRCREGASSPRVSKISRWMGSSSPTPTARSWLGRVT